MPARVSPGVIHAIGKTAVPSDYKTMHVII